MTEITDADRKAAAALAREIGEPDIAANILAGIRDPYAWCQAFAAHREATEAAIVGWLRKCANGVPNATLDDWTETLARMIAAGAHRS